MTIIIDFNCMFFMVISFISFVILLKTLKFSKEEKNNECKSNKRKVKNY